MAQENKCALCGLLWLDNPVKQVISRIATYFPLVPEDNRTSGIVEAMALEDADRTDDASAVPITTEAKSPCERSRSDKREVVHKASQVASVPGHDATRFSHRGRDFHASREGLPNGPDLCIRVMPSFNSKNRKCTTR